MEATPSRVVLREHVSRDDIDDAALASGWKLTNVLPPNAQQPAQLIYHAAGGRGLLHLVEDARLGVLYFAAAGEAAVVLAQVREQLAWCKPGDHEALLLDHSDSARVRRGLGMLVLGTATPSQADEDVLRTCLGHDDVAIRSAALTALSYAPWSGLRADVVNVREGDAQPMLRGAAAQLLQALYPAGGA